MFILSNGMICECEFEKLVIGNIVSFFENFVSKKERKKEDFKSVGLREPEEKREGEQTETWKKRSSSIRPCIIN